MSTRSRKDEQDAKTFRNSLRLTQLSRLGVPFNLSRQVSFLFEQHHVLWPYSVRAAGSACDAPITTGRGILL